MDNTLVEEDSTSGAVGNTSGAVGSTSVVEDSTLVAVGTVEDMGKEQAQAQVYTVEGQEQGMELGMAVEQELGTVEEQERARTRAETNVKRAYMSGTMNSLAQDLERVRVLGMVEERERGMVVEPVEEQECSWKESA